MKHNTGVSNIEITDQNIRAFSATAKKYDFELMTQNAIALMDGSKRILHLQDVRPFFSDKLDITCHPHYMYLADADKKNNFDNELYMNRRSAIVKPDEPLDLHDIDINRLSNATNLMNEREAEYELFTNAIDVLQALVIAHPERRPVRVGRHQPSIQKVTAGHPCYQGG